MERRKQKHRRLRGLRRNTKTHRMIAGRRIILDVQQHSRVFTQEDSNNHEITYSVQPPRHRKLRDPKEKNK